MQTDPRTERKQGPLFSKQNTDSKVEVKRNRVLKMYQSLDHAALREA